LADLSSNFKKLTKTLHKHVKKE